MTKTKNQTSRRKKPWVLALIILLVVIVSVIVVVCVAKPQTAIPEQPSAPASTPQSPETPASSDIPDSSVVESPAPTPEAPEKTPQYEGENPNNLEELTGVITYKGVEDGVLIVMTMLNQYLHQAGTCFITLMGQNSRNSYTASVSAHGDATASYCENFEIPISNLTPDTYTIEIKLTGDGKIGTIRDEVSL